MKQPAMFRAVPVALAVALLSASAASASTIDFTFTGTGTGTFGGTPFTSASFEIDGVANTANVQPFPGQPGVIFIPFTSATMTLSGFAINGAVTPNLDIYDYSGRGGLEADVKGTPSYNLIDGLPGNYDLVSALGPVTFNPSSFGQFIDGFTLNGNQVDFSAMGPVTFTATLGAVPELSTWAMMLAGFGLIGFAMRKRSHVRTSVRYA